MEWISSKSSLEDFLGSKDIHVCMLRVFFFFFFFFVSVREIIYLFIYLFIFYVLELWDFEITYVIFVSERCCLCW